MTAPESHNADLDWLAFRYAANELQGAELETFEALLASDEHACAALARAVLLTQAVVVCEQQSGLASVSTVMPLAGSARTTVPAGQSNGPLNGRRAFRRTVVAMACGVASLMVVFGGLTLTSSREAATTEAATTVAALWIQGADEFPAVDSVVASNQDAAGQDVADQDVTDMDEEDAVPGWLLAAVNQQQQADEADEILQD